MWATNFPPTSQASPDQGKCSRDGHFGVEMPRRHHRKRGLFEAARAHCLARSAELAIVRPFLAVRSLDRVDHDVRDHCSPRDHDKVRSVDLDGMAPGANCHDELGVSSNCTVMFGDEAPRRNGQPGSGGRGLCECRAVDGALGGCEHTPLLMPAGPLRRSDESQRPSRTARCQRCRRPSCRSVRRAGHGFADVAFQSSDRCTKSKARAA